MAQTSAAAMCSAIRTHRWRETGFEILVPLKGCGWSEPLLGKAMSRESRQFRSSSDVDPHARRGSSGVPTVEGVPRAARRV
jgi:hypothetical protein